MLEFKERNRISEQNDYSSLKETVWLLWPASEAVYQLEVSKRKLNVAGKENSN